MALRRTFSSGLFSKEHNVEEAQIEKLINQKFEDFTQHLTLESAKSFLDWLSIDMNVWTVFTGSMTKNLMDENINFLNRYFACVDLEKKEVTPPETYLSLYKDFLEGENPKLNVDDSEIKQNFDALARENFNSPNTEKAFNELANSISALVGRNFIHKSILTKELKAALVEARIQTKRSEPQNYYTFSN